MQNNLYLYPNLIKVRKDKKLTQAELAKQIGISQQEISRYENGIRQADYKTLIAFADYFNVSIDYLLERTDNPTFLAE